MPALRKPSILLMERYVGFASNVTFQTPGSEWLRQLVRELVYYLSTWIDVKALMNEGKQLLNEGWWSKARCTSAKEYTRNSPRWLT
jgi:hypothetical protein